MEKRNNVNCKRYWHTRESWMKIQRMVLNAAAAEFNQCLMIFTHSTCASLSLSHSLTPAAAAVVIHSLKHVWASEYTTTANAAAAFAIYSRWISSSLLLLLLLFDRLCCSHSVCNAFLLLLLLLLCSILCWSLALFILTFCPLSSCVRSFSFHMGFGPYHTQPYTLIFLRCTATERNNETKTESVWECVRSHLMRYMTITYTYKQVILYRLCAKYKLNLCASCCCGGKFVFVSSLSRSLSEFEKGGICIS